MAEKQKKNFYSGRVLRLDMTHGHATVEPLPRAWTERYVGGKGLLLRYLFSELAPGTQPLSPASPLILATGPFAGTVAPTCSRLAVGCKSPATGTLLDSYVGGSFGSEMKFAGYDVIIVQGRSPHPVVVSIANDRVSFLPALDRYAGLETSDLEQAVRDDFGARAKVLSVGPAGEKGLPFACLSTDQYHKAGRGGAGAVMGSKNLKAIIVQGDGAVEVEDCHNFTAEMAKLQRERLLSDENIWACEEGTPILVDAINAGGALPTRNWRTGMFDGAGQINSDVLLRYRVKVRSCTQCTLACRQVHTFGSRTAEGPEYETIALCGSNCGIDDMEAISLFNHECDELGLDTISTGSVVALAMDLAERGIADYGLRFGDPETYVRAPRMIAMREGLGAHMADGAQALAVRHGCEHLASQVKNLEMPGYDPRGSFGMGLAYATSDRGACHMRGFPVGDEILTGTLAPDTLQGKAAYVASAQDFMSLSYTGIWCANWATDLDIIGRHMAYLWRRDVSTEELTRVGERIWNLGRLLNLREGVKASADTLPDRILNQGHADGIARDRVIGSEPFAAAVKEYYTLRGWDKTGTPTEDKLRELDVDVRL